MLVIQLYICLLQLLTLSNSKEEEIRAPVPVAPKIRTTTPKVALDNEMYVTDDNCGERRPFFIPTETMDIYTETATVTTMETIRTSKIVEIGTTSTLTKSLTVTRTTTQTTTELFVSVAYATTTVNLSKKVFGGTVTTTKVIDTTVVSTLYITPIAATSVSFVTKVTRTTVTQTVTGTTVERSFGSFFVTSETTILVQSVRINYDRTTTLSVFLQVAGTTTSVRTVYAVTRTSTPANWGLATTTQTVIINTGVVVTFPSLFIITNNDPIPETTTIATIENTARTTLETSVLFTYTEPLFSSLLIT